MIILSPSKGMDNTPYDINWISTLPRNMPISSKIAAHLKGLTLLDIQDKMKVSDKIALETKAIFKNWRMKSSTHIQSIFAYSGDVYGGLEAKSLDIEALNFANNHLRIISGLYGLLRPSDVVMPYRLEIGYRYPIGELGKLYPLWKPIITQHLISDLKTEKSTTLFNLASKEYSTALDQTRFKAYKWIDFEFFEEKNGKLQFASYHAKRARGLMCRYIIENKIIDLEPLLNFDFENYRYSEKNSSDCKLVFVR
jgi:uncharacterized protein